jgi:pre-mRNA-splicing factor SYF1
MLFEEEDLPYEEDCIRNPFSLKSWLRYIDYKSKANTSWVLVYLIYERALKQLPTSYRLWFNYLRVRRVNLKSKAIDDTEYEEVNDLYERALIYMNKVISLLAILLLGFPKFHSSFSDAAYMERLLRVPVRTVSRH